MDVNSFIKQNINLLSTNTFYYTTWLSVEDFIAYTKRNVYTELINVQYFVRTSKTEHTFNVIAGYNKRNYAYIYTIFDPDRYPSVITDSIIIFISKINDSYIQLQYSNERIGLVINYSNKIFSGCAKMKEAEQYALKCFNLNITSLLNEFLAIVLINKL